MPTTTMNKQEFLSMMDRINTGGQTALVEEKKQALKALFDAINDRSIDTRDKMEWDTSDPTHPYSTGLSQTYSDKLLNVIKNNPNVFGRFDSFDAVGITGPEMAKFLTEVLKKQSELLLAAPPPMLDVEDTKLAAMETEAKKVRQEAADAVAKLEASTKDAREQAAKNVEEKQSIFDDLTQEKLSRKQQELIALEDHKRQADLIQALEEKCRGLTDRIQDQRETMVDKNTFIEVCRQSIQELTDKNIQLEKDKENYKEPYQKGQELKKEKISLKKEIEEIRKVNPTSPRLKLRSEWLEYIDKELVKVADGIMSYENLDQEVTLNLRKIKEMEEKITFFSSEKDRAEEELEKHRKQLGLEIDNLRAAKELQDKIRSFIDDTRAKLTQLPAKIANAENEKSIALEEQKKADGNLPALRDSLKKADEQVDLYAIIKQKKEELKTTRNDLDSAIKATPADYKKIKALKGKYETLLQDLKKNLELRNETATDENKATPLRPPLTRAVSSYSTEKANLVVEIGTSLHSGFKREIVTDKKRIGEIIKETQPGANAIGNAGSSHYLHAALLPDEIQVSSQAFSDKDDVVIRQDKTKEVVVNARGNLTPQQKQLAAIEAAKMYAINYNGTDIPEIRGEDAVMSSMMHAALLKFLPEVAKNKIKNFTPGSGLDYGYFSSMRNKAKEENFIKEQLKGMDTHVAEALDVVNDRRKQRELIKKDEGKIQQDSTLNNSEKEAKLEQIQPKEGQSGTYRR